MTSPTPSMTAPAAPNPALDGHLLRIIAGGTKRTTSHPPARAAQRRAERYRRFLDALGVAVYTTDSDGKITFFNAAAAEFWGRRPAVGEEWCGSLRLLFLDESPMRHDECPMAITLKEARPVRGGQAIAVRPDGSNVSFMAYPTPLFDDDGQLIGAVNVLVDITERHRAEQAIRAAADALEASNAVKDEFLGLVSHELRTPVTTIFGNARLLQARGAELDDETRASMIADIATDADRLHSIIENLLHLTRLGSGSRLDLEPQVLDRVVEHAVASFGARNPDRTVEVTSARPRAIVEGDETYITLLLENLLSNAVKYSPAGSPVEVAITTVGDEVVVEVLDRGIGLGDVDGERLFEPFFRAEPAKTAANGLGIGLALCQRIVAALGGRIWARPRDGGGAAVGFALPIAADAEPPKPSRPRDRSATDRAFGRSVARRPDRRARRLARERVPIGAGRSEDVDDDRPVRSDADLVRRVGRDPPRAARAQLTRLVADREGHAPGDDHPELLVLVTMSGHDRVRRELDEGQGDPLAFDPAGANGLAPHVDDRHVGHVDQVAHVSSFSRGR